MAYDESEHNSGGATGGAGSKGTGGSAGGKGNGGTGAGAIKGYPSLDANAQAALSRNLDIGNYGNTTMDDIGNAIAGALGFNELGGPNTVKNNNLALAGGAFGQTKPGTPVGNMNADWGFDPIGAALGAGGMATGLPLGTAYSGIRALTDKFGLTDPDWGKINLGPDVFGGGKAKPGTVGNGKGGRTGGAPIQRPPVPVVGKTPTGKHPLNPGALDPSKPTATQPQGTATKPAVMTAAGMPTAPGPVAGPVQKSPFDILLNPGGHKPPVTKPPVGKPPVNPPVVTGKPPTNPLIDLLNGGGKPKPPVTPPVTKPPVTPPGTLKGGLPPAFYDLLAKKVKYTGDPNQLQAWLKAHNLNSSGDPITQPPVTPPVTKPPVTPPVKPPVTPPVVTPPVTPGALPASWAAELAKFAPQLQKDYDWAMGQRGLNKANPVGQVFGATNNDWGNAFNSELQHRISEVPLGTTGLTDQAKIDAALNQYLLPNFGNSALDDYQTRMRSTMSNNPMLSGLQKGFDDKFSLAGVQPYLDEIYNTQYGQAKQLMDNTKARGEFNDLGYSSALKDLGTQGLAGKSKLSDLAQGFLTTDKGTLGDSLSGIYNKIGGYTLGSGYNPNSDVGNINTQANTMYGNLKGQITGAAPSLFDTGTTMQKAGTSQGMTSSGSLLDTLAQRNTSLQNRGLGSTGAF